MDSTFISEILTETNKIIPHQTQIEFPSKMEKEIFHYEQENLSPKTFFENENEQKKVPAHFRQNRIRTLPSRTTSSSKSSKLIKIETGLKSIIKKSNEKQLLHSRSLKLGDCNFPQKEEYPTLLKRKSIKSEIQSSDCLDLNQFELNQLLSTSLSDVNYGDVFPGAVHEKELIIKNKSIHNFAIKILVGCTNENLNQLDEYVFSVAKIEKFNFDEKLLIIVPANHTFKAKLALKVPNIQEKCHMKGFYSIEIIGLKEVQTFALEAFLKIPNIICPKEIYDSNNKTYVLKFALKKRKKMDFKVALKNDSDQYIEGMFELLCNSKESEGDLMIFPTTANIPPFAMFFANMVLKPKNILLKNIPNFTVINKILLFKVRNSSLIYFYALSIEMYP